MNKTAERAVCVEIITTDADESVAEIHDRMPLILPPAVTRALSLSRHAHARQHGRIQGRAR
jgi:putative SOS response-associated peptidase YedK